MTRMWGAVVTVPLLCRAHGLPEPTAEFRFHPTRKWRADFAWETEKVLLDIEGGLFAKGRAGMAHAMPTSILRDIEKSNAAQLLGFRFLRCTPADVASGAVAALLTKALRS